MALPKGVSASSQRRLNDDLARGVVLYRRVPGSNRKYYDPKRPELEPVTEHYVLRVYKPRLLEAEQQRIRDAVKANVRLQASARLSFADTWSRRQRAMGKPVTTRNVALKDAEFKKAYQEFRVAAYQARYQNKLENDNRHDLFNSGSTYSNLLVSLGRRTGEESFPVGESPSQVGPGESYIDKVVTPFLERQAQGALAKAAATNVNVEIAQALGIPGAENMNDRQLKIAIRRADPNYFGPT